MIKEVTVTLSNTGSRAGKETVQVYRIPTDAGEPVRLIGWAQVSLDPGTNGTVQVRCDTRTQRTWDVAEHRWLPLSGGSIAVARGLGDLRTTLPLEIGQES